MTIGITYIGDLNTILGNACPQDTKVVGKSQASTLGPNMHALSGSTWSHFCAWLGLAPRNAISGGKVLRSHTAKVANRATQAFRMAAFAVSRSDTAVGAYYRAMRARKGPQQANVATAHNIARIVYHLLKYGEEYREESAEEFEQKRQERELRHLSRRAQKLGYTLTPVAA